MYNYKLCFIFYFYLKKYLCRCILLMRAERTICGSAVCIFISLASLWNSMDGCRVLYLVGIPYMYAFDLAVRGSFCSFKLQLHCLNKGDQK